jgi:hypothetical protein
MRKQPDGTSGKKPPAPSVKVGDFRSLVEILKGRRSRGIHDGERSRRFKPIPSRRGRGQSALAPQFALKSAVVPWSPNSDPVSRPEKHGFSRRMLAGLVRARLAAAGARGGAGRPAGGLFLTLYCRNCTDVSAMSGRAQTNL